MTIVPAHEHPDTGLPVIDTHVHVWDAGAPWMRWLSDRPSNWDRVRRDFTWEDLCAVLDAAAVDRLILVQAATAVRESQLLLEFARAHQRVAGVVGWASFADPRTTEANLDALRRYGDVIGIRALNRWHPDGDILGKLREDGSTVIDSCRVLAERGLPLDLFLDSHEELPLAAVLAERAPGDLRLVIDHLGRPPIGAPGTFEGWATQMKRLSQLPNVYVKYSGWATMIGRADADDVRPYIEFVLEHFGARRVMYASNWPVALVADTYATTFDATLGAVSGLGSADLREILSGTAKRCYLGDTAGGK